MKRKITLSIALALSIVLVSLMSSDSKVGAQNQLRYTADTGFVTLIPGQILRVSVSLGKYIDRDGRFTFRRIEYAQGVCSGGVCKHTVASQSASAPITLMLDEAASFDIPAGGSGVRGIVVSNTPNMRVNAVIIDSATGAVVSLVNNESFKEVIFDF